MRISNALSLAAVGLVTGCIIHTTEPAPSRTTTTSARTGTMTSSAARIADARCDRAAYCNDIGAGHHYEDRASCNREARRDAEDKLDHKDCAAGVDEARLNECVREIRNARCGNPIDSIEKSAACRRSELCRR